MRDMAFLPRVAPPSPSPSPPLRLYTRRTHIFDLPIEVFVLVLELLTSRDLLSCATVCSQWRDPALDVKWKESLVQWDFLLRVLGPLETCDDDPNTYRWVNKHNSINDAIASAGCRRLNELRKKITRLRVETPFILGDIDYLQSIHYALESPGHAFCPKLRELTICFNGRQPNLYDFLAGESLRQFWMYRTPSIGRPPAGVYGGVLESIAVQSPGVEHISVTQSDSPFIDYGKFSNIRTLYHSGNFSVASWIKLCAGCPLLENLNLRLTQTRLVDEEAIAGGPQVQQLPALRVLNMATVRDNVFRSYVFQTTNMPQLGELKVNIRGLESVEADGLLSLLARRSPLLVTLQVYGCRLGWGRFASFSKLRNLELHGELSSWTTEHMERIVTHLPDLDRLWIVSWKRYGFGQVFTPAILETIAMRSQLHQLAIPLNALEIPWISETLAPTAKFDVLVELSLEPLYIKPSAIEPFAKYLAQLCPSAEYLETTILHSHSTDQEMEERSFLTDEETKSCSLMKNLFFDVRKRYAVSGSTSEGS